MTGRYSFFLYVWILLGYTRPRIKHQHISLFSTNECMLLGAQKLKSLVFLQFLTKKKKLLSQTLSENKQLGWKCIKNWGQLQWEVTDISLHQLLSITRVNLWNGSATRWGRCGKENCFTIFFTLLSSCGDETFTEMLRTLRHKEVAWSEYALGWICGRIKTLIVRKGLIKWLWTEGRTSWGSCGKEKYFSIYYAYVILWRWDTERFLFECEFSSQRKTALVLSICCFSFSNNVSSLLQSL